MLSVVIPTYDEATNVPGLLERLGAALAGLGEPFEVILVDDDSPDGTSGLARALEPRYPWLRVLTRKHQRDLSTAVLAGWLQAKGELLAVIDGDLQHPPELLPRLVERLRASGADIVIASRHVKGGGVSQWSLWRRAISWAATLLADLILPGTLSRVRDPMSGFFVLRRQVIEQAPLRPVGYKILLEVLAKGNYQKTEEAPYVFQERAHGGSKLGPAHAWRYLLHLASISLDTGEFRRMCSYLAVGVTGAVINLSVFAILARAFGASPRLAIPLATLCAAVNNFTWNDRFTFPETRRRAPGLAASASRFQRFLSICMAGALVNILLAATLIRFLDTRAEWAVAAGIAAGGAWNFLLNSRLTWQVWWDRNVHLHRLQPGDWPPVPETLRCNLCGGGQFILLCRGVRRAKAAAAGAFRCTSFGHGDYTNIVRCISCSLVIQAPADPPAQIEESYRNVSDPTYSREEQGRVRTFDRLLGEIEEVTTQLRASGEGRTSPSPSGRRLLNVGCYTGVFLDRARKHGWNVTGLEPSAWAAAIARQRGFPVLSRLLTEAGNDPQAFGLEAESFDLVTIWDVIEHFVDPRAELATAARLLRPGGLLALSTMDVESAFARLLGPRWPWLMRMHLYYFSPDTLRALLSRCGLDVLEVRRHRRIVSARYLLQKVAAQSAWLFPTLSLAARLPLLGNIHVPVNLGDIINVYAVKPASKG